MSKGTVVIRIIPVAWLIVVVLLHIGLNRHYYDLYDGEGAAGKLRKGHVGCLAPESSHPRIGHEYRLDIIELRPNDIVRLTGPLSWRLVGWGVIRGNSEDTWTTAMRDLGAPEWFIRVSNVTNPTPVTILAILVIINIVSVIRAQSSR